MSKKDEQEVSQPTFVITCGDEGVQVNKGTRLSFVGAGVNLEGFDVAAKILNKILGADIRIVGSHENDWVKKEFNLDTWEQVAATFQQHLEVIADQNGLAYSGMLPFTDPREMKNDIKGHMVRPKGVHVASNICFTLAGGEQTYNLGQFQISAEWVSKAPKKVVESVINTQVEFYKTLAGGKPKFFFEEDGILGEKVAAKNRKIIEKLGYKAEEVKKED